MMMFGSLFFGIGIVAAFALGLAFIFDTQFPEMRWQRRALWSGLCAGFLPMILPIVVVLIEGDGDPELWISLVALLFGALFLAAVVGFPVAYFFCKRRHEARNPPNPETTFE